MKRIIIVLLTLLLFACSESKVGPTGAQGEKGESITVTEYQGTLFADGLVDNDAGAVWELIFYPSGIENKTVFVSVNVRMEPGTLWMEPYYFYETSSLAIGVRIFDIVNLLGANYPSISYVGWEYRVIVIY